MDKNTDLEKLLGLPIGSTRDGEKDLNNTIARGVVRKTKELGGELIVQTIQKIADGKLETRVNDTKNGSYFDLNNNHAELKK